jgi:hypothetical protein
MDDPSADGSWWMAAQTFIRWGRLKVWERLLMMAQAQSMQVGMTFLDDTNIRAHRPAAGAAQKGAAEPDALRVKLLADLVAALSALLTSLRGMRHSPMDRKPA